MKTGVITYNLNERGRTHIGQNRNFNIPALMKIVNGAAFQEQIKAGDVVGYLGHDIRQQFGLTPPEVILSDGKFVPLEPAFRTRYIKVHEDGTVEHEEEFLDTPLGRAAKEWFTGKYGGFSSVVAPNERNPTAFHGFDYVGMPNFITNRGYVMDSADGNDYLSRLTSKQKAQFFEAAMREKQAVMDAVISGSMAGAKLLDNMSQSHQQLLQTVELLSRELEETSDKLKLLELEKQQREQFEPIMRLSVDASENWVMDSANSFQTGEKRSGLILQNYDSLLGYEFNGLSLVGKK